MENLKTFVFVIGLLLARSSLAQTAPTALVPSHRAKGDSSVSMSSTTGINLQESDVYAPRLEVRLIPDKNVVTDGQILRLRVEFWNIGRKDLFVCKDFQLPNNSACGLTFTITPVGKGPGEGGAVDCGAPAGESFAMDIAKEWVLLPPNHFYGTIINIDPDSYGGALTTPGRYRIKADYFSAGLAKADGPMTCNRVAFYTKEIASLSAKVWEGNMHSEPMVIDVIAKLQRQAAK